MPLPFIPESIESMKARFPECLEKVWIDKEILQDKRPGQDRKYVFDFASGLRLLISKLEFFKHPTNIHVSASWEYKPPMKANIEELTTEIWFAYKSIGGRGNLKFLGQSPGKMIPHWMVIDDSRN